MYHFYQSAYHETYDKDRDLLAALYEKGDKIFTSVHMPEDSEADSEKIVKMCHELDEMGYEIIADCSPRSLQRFGVDTFKDLANKLRLDCLRIDFGLTPVELLEVAQTVPIAVNATMMRPKYKFLMAQAADFVTAIHNYFPRPETGIDRFFFAEQNRMFRDLGIPVYSFVPGDPDRYRGPIRAGLPTMELHRNMTTFAAYCDTILGDVLSDQDRMFHEGKVNYMREPLDESSRVTGCFVGDGVAGPGDIAKVKRFFVSLEISLDYIPLTENADNFLLENAYHIRHDSPQNTLRFTESREFASLGAPVAPENTIERKRGMLTIDNDRYGRYSGEIQLLKTDRPADERVNCIGKLTPESMQLLPLLGPDARVYLSAKVD